LHFASNPSKVVKNNIWLPRKGIEAIPLSAFPKDTTRKLAGFPPQYQIFMLNVKQGRYESRASVEKFPGRANGKNKTINSIIEPPSTLSVPSMKI